MTSVSDQSLQRSVQKPCDRSISSQTALLQIHSSVHIVITLFSYREKRYGFA